MYSKVRAYLRDQIKSVIPKAYEHKDVFNVENIASSKIDEAFHIAYSPASISIGQQNVETTVTVIITLFFKAERDVQVRYDSAMDLASNVMRTCASTASVYAARDIDGYPIQQVAPTGINTEQFDTNDNTFKIILSMDLLIIETIC
tara:strand:+ start:840 stop:1277 length:438 start_codon:yes stop_codon:yes gene_type:complete